MPEQDTSSRPPGLAHRATIGGMWMILQRLVVRSIGLVSTIILARLLVPADFGIVAIATSISGLLDSLSDLGLELALIHKAADAKEDYDSAWTLSLVRGALMAVVLLALAYPAASFYSEPRLVVVMALLALSTFIGAAQNIGVVDFRRNLRFDREFRILVWSKVAAFTVTLSLAMLFRSYLALIAGIVCGKLTTVALTYLYHPYRPRLSFSRCADFIGFSKWLCLDNFVLALKSRSDTFVIGKLASAHVLGVYAIAYEISNLATTELVSPILRVLFPSFAQIKHDRNRLAAAYVESVSTILTVAVPVVAGIAIVAPYIVAIFLGPQWNEAIVLIRVLALCGLFTVSTVGSSALYLSFNRPDLLVFRNLPALVIQIPLLIFGTHAYGALGGAWAMVASALVNFITNMARIQRELPIDVSALVKAMLRPVAAAATMIAVCSYVPGPPPEAAIGDVILAAAMTAAVGVVVYGAALALLWRLSGCPAGPEKRALQGARVLYDRLAPGHAGAPERPQDCS